MDAPVKELEQLKSLQSAAKTHLDESALDQAQTCLEQAQSIEPGNPRTLELMSRLAEGRGDAQGAERLKEKAATLRKEAWQRQVEAEIRGKHELMGEAIRKETL